MSPPSIHSSVCLPPLPLWGLFSVVVWPHSCPPRGGGTLGPLTYPRSGSRVERVREGGKKKRATTALWVGSASFTEVSENKSGSHYVSDLDCSIKKQHLGTCRQAALCNPTEKKKVIWGLGWVIQLNKKPFEQSSKTDILVGCRHDNINAFCCNCSSCQRALWWLSCLIHQRQSLSWMNRTSHTVCV